MEFYWYVLLLIILVGIAFFFFPVADYVKQILSGANSIYSLILFSFIIMFLAVIFMFMSGRSQ